MRLITPEDVQDIEVDPNWSPLHMLGAVCERALEIYAKETKNAKKISMSQVEENSPSRMVEFPKSLTRINLKTDTAIVDGDEISNLTNAERRELKKRVMGFDMTGYTSWKSNNTTDHVTWSVKDALDKKEGGLITDEAEELLSRQERLRREKKLKRPMEEAERRRIRGSSSSLKRKRSDQEKKCVAKKRDFKRIQSKTKHIPMPEHVKNRIKELGKQVKELKLIIEKGIYKTDASKSHNRLSIPISQIVEKFLREEEEEYLGNRVNSKKVRVIEPSLKISELVLRRWEMKKEKSMSVCYVLNGKWTKIRTNNHIKMGSRIQLWAVRMDDEELIIVLVKLPDDEEEGDQVNIKEGDQVTTEGEDIEEQEGSDSKTNVASTSKQHEY
ncbi:B3 domain-containing protein At1g05920-like [Capsicum annuum]|uniref:B3 domain-containing protein At1g05920-like n=1 Tax=Capsicum annuum TaxID=4072 RepID=UPI001FB17B08|nr:B3 domain-containing protein At1g05920-like [Capsicum annuum]